MSEVPDKPSEPLLARVASLLTRPDSLAKVILLVASYAFRLPPLLNARSTNSDAAVVGLQAMHMLRGELSPFLWGSGYQTSADSAVAALFFLVLGPSPVVLMLSALTLHVVATFLVFATLRRRFEPWLALVATMPLVVSPSSVHSYALYPPRQLSLTLALAAFWAIDRALGGEKRARWLALGGVLAAVAVAADPYPMVLLPVAAVYGGMVAWRGGEGEEIGHVHVHVHGESESRRKRVAALVAGGVVGMVPFWGLHRLAGARSGPMGITTAMLRHHWRLLVDECLPWALSYKVYFARNVMDYRAWEAPTAFTALGILGAIVVGCCVAYGIGAVWSGAPARVRMLGFAGAMVFPLVVGAFLVSVMVMDHFSMRYLAVLTLMMPFALLPAAHALGRRNFALVIAPHLVAAAIGGWVGYGPFVRGMIPVRETPELKDDHTLFAMLRARGVRYATADYWASYRLTYLFREELVVVPTNPGEDRYAPYRRAFEAAPVFAYVFDPGRSREDLATAEAELRSTHERVEALRAGGLTVFLVMRR